ncbi:hypothetical protein [Cohnella luojiensis]|uniref:Uncharacterized protein n=1 Tax=Cohnella luojiensis TaxID=652876 RepID=A0A4Y8M3E6_9BACL|nr:hypothetical protein [Cohnella luojiensis]TFE27269.1 hypothetical protein E2980_10255 [Cohnella luojiensis]
MEQLWKQIGTHSVLFRVIGAETMSFMNQMFGERSDSQLRDPDTSFTITIQQGCLKNPGINTTFTRDVQGRMIFDRPDYYLAISPDYREADVRFYNYVGLRCVLMNWYSTIITHYDWGLLVHSSTLVDQGEAYVFAGKSRVGKTTVAKLSHPRTLLSDEASILKIGQDGRVIVYDSPLRSNIMNPSPIHSVPIKAIYMLEQSPIIKKRRLDKSKALLSILENIWYWPHNNEDSLKVVRLCKALVEQVPVYRLKFQKNELFWEEIS